MLQNNILFNQSSVKLEIIGLPDYSNNESKDNISIISQWKLTIINQPLIEGNLDHLKSFIEAFYTYTNYLLNTENPKYQSKLIDIKQENHLIHDVILKSTKPNVKPLNLKIGNSCLADIINCFDQLGSSEKVKIIYSKDFSFLFKKQNKSLFHKANISNVLLPPLISLFSIFIISSGLVYFYDATNEQDTSILNSENSFISIKTL